MRAMRIGYRITLMYGGIFTIALIFFGAVILGNVMFLYRKASVDELNQIARRVSGFIEEGGEITEESVRRMNPHKYVDIVIMIVTGPHSRAQGVPDGKPVFRSAASDANSDAILEDADEVLINGRSPGQLMNYGALQYIFGQSFATYGGVTYHIRVFRDFYREMEITRLTMLVFAVFCCLGTAGAFVVGRSISRMTLKPIGDIRRTAERIGIEDLSRRIPLSGPDDEIKELSVTFNDMIERLESSFLKQSQFIADASHELRTPISVIQGYAGLLDRWGKNDRDVLQESIDSIIAETGHMSMLVKKLLFMAKADQDRLQIQMQPVSIGSLAAETAKEMEMIYSSHKIILKNNAPSGGDVAQGDYDLLKQLFWILLDNGVKYSPGSPDIEITVNPAECGCELVVRDHGIGIDESELPHIFERFYRADKSRSGEVPGTGLGLSIAEGIMKRHGGSIRVKSEAGKGTEVTVSFVN